jgi:hypothetical protein
LLKPSLTFVSGGFYFSLNGGKTRSEVRIFSPASDSIGRASIASQLSRFFAQDRGGIRKIRLDCSEFLGSVLRRHSGHRRSQRSERWAHDLFKRVLLQGHDKQAAAIVGVWFTRGMPGFFEAVDDACNCTGR